MHLQRYPRCILAACCIPWTDTWDLEEDLFRRSIRDIRDKLSRHLYIFGTAGEGYAVDRDTFLEVCRVFREETSGDGVHPMVGVISLSTREIIGRIEAAAGLGFTDFQISLPAWGACTPEETRRFFREVCGRFPDFRFLHYNLPRAGRIVTPAEYTALAEENPNLVATKNSTADMARLRGLLDGSPQLTHFFTEAGYAYGALAGECGFLVSVASSDFTLARRYFELGQSRKTAELLDLQGRLIAFTNELIAQGKPGAHIDGAFDKLFIKRQLPDFPLRLLPPYEGSDEASFEAYQKLFHKHLSR